MAQAAGLYDHSCHMLIHSINNTLEMHRHTYPGNLKRPSCFPLALFSDLRGIVCVRVEVPVSTKPLVQL